MQVCLFSTTKNILNTRTTLKLKLNIIFKMSFHIHHLKVLKKNNNKKSFTIHFTHVDNEVKIGVNNFIKTNTVKDIGLKFKALDYKIHTLFKNQDT